MNRPAFHYRPQRNWINDPNGLCQVNGWYHMFFQYNPHGSVWGDIHWGHARSRDMLRWETMPMALVPQAEKGEIHCFSGSCCKDEQGLPHFFYTSIGDVEAGRGSADGAQQWMALPADAELSRLEQTDEFALTDDIHGPAHVREWRDPCVLRWRGQYLMVLGGCLDGKGCALLYTSPDMRHWTYRHVLAQAEQADNVPWECPNFFPLDDRFVLIYSPCAQVMAKVGVLDDDLRFTCLREEVLEPAQWQGYYAPQAFEDEAGRRILMGWMPECDGELSQEKGWSGVMSLPRVLRVKEDRLLAAPVEGVDSLARWTTVYAAPGETCLTLHGRRLLVRMCCEVKEDVVFRLFAGEACQTTLTLTTRGDLLLDRSCSSTDARISRTPLSRTIPMPEGHAEIFLALDESTLECCVNGQWLSARVYPPEGCDGAYLISPVEAEVLVGEVTE